MEKLKLFTIIVFVYLTIVSCTDALKAQSEYNKRSWEIKKMKMELDYLKELHKYRCDLEMEHKIKQVDSLIKEYH